jgi:hypothetical protein
MSRTLYALALCGALAVCYGCSSDSGSGPAPEVAVSLDPDAMDVEVGRHATIATEVTGTSNEGLTWYVNGIENGNDVFGTITQNSPATYTAPDTLPGLTTVEVRAISVADTTKYDSCMVTITFKVIHVDIASGDDTDGTGYAHDPVKSIYRGNQLASEGGTVLVAPGTYDTDHGETFPIYPKAGVTLEGENWETCIIRGGSKWGYAISIGLAGSAVRKFTFESAPELGVDRWEHYIYLRGDNARLDSLRTAQRTYYAPVRIKDAANAIVENCVFAVPFLDPAPGGIGQNRGFEILGGNTGNIIRGCTISGFREALQMGYENDPLIENCIIENNEYGLYLCCYQDDDHNPNPDLGGGARGSAGGNTIRNNAECGIYNQTYSVIYAKYNTWTNDPPVAGEDYCNTSTGGVVYE